MPVPRIENEDRKLLGSSEFEKTWDEAKRPRQEMMAKKPISRDLWSESVSIADSKPHGFK
jgi:hypothetical protein